MVFGAEPLRDILDHMITLDCISLASNLSVKNLLIPLLFSPLLTSKSISTVTICQCS